MKLTKKMLEAAAAAAMNWPSYLYCSSSWQHSPGIGGG